MPTPRTVTETLIYCLKPISPFDSTHYAHTDHSRITTESWEIPFFSSANGAII